MLLYDYKLIGGINTMTNLNMNTVEALTKAVGVHSLLDSVLARLDSKTAQDIMTAIMAENDLELQQ